MVPNLSLSDSLFIQKVIRARRTSPAKKFLAGPRLFEYARNVALGAIKAENPNASPEEIRHLFRQRKNITRYLEQHPL